ncbi:hypothetical protein HID58_034062, partial [Brassica napus]
TFKMEHPKEQIYCCFAKKASYVANAEKCKVDYHKYLEEGRKEDEAIQLYSQRLMMKTMLRMVVKSSRVVLTKSTTALLPKANEVSRLKLLRTMTSFFCFPIDAKNQKGYILRTVKWRITTYVSKSLPDLLPELCCAPGESRSQQDDALYWCIVEAILPGKVKPQDAVKDILKEFMENI